MEQNLANLSKFDFTNIDFDLIARLFLLGLLIFYGVFVLIVYKQVKILNKTIHTPSAGLVNTLAFGQLLVTWSALVIVILLLLL